MKKLFLCLLLISVFQGLQAQTIDWGIGPFAGYSSTNSHSITSDATSFTFDSDHLYAKFWLATDGHTLHYDVQAKNIPYTSPTASGEFQASLWEDTGESTYGNFLGKYLAWNAPDYYTYPFIKTAFPGSDYSYAGSCDLQTAKYLMLTVQVLYWDEIDPSFVNKDAGFTITPIITP